MTQTFRDRYLQELNHREEQRRKQFWTNCLRHTDIPWEVCPPVETYGPGPRMVHSSVLAIYERVRGMVDTKILYCSTGEPLTLDEVDVEASLLLACRDDNGTDHYFAYVPEERVKNFYR